jgi:hypothetical protein
MNSTKNFLKNYPGVSFALVVIISVLLIFGIMAASDYAGMKSCLNNDAPRRWHNGICEAYQDNEWLQVSPFRDSKIHYNKKSRGD